MSFATYETSVERGQPVELYIFRYGAASEQYYAYTDGEVEIQVGAITYTPIPIKRGPITITGTLDKAALTINMPGSGDVPELFRVYAPSSVVTVEIRQGHVNDADKDFRLIWSGRVLNCRWTNREAALTCEPITTSLKRPGLRRNYQYGCPHVLYDPRTCRANKAAATVAATVQVINGTLVTLSVTGAYEHEGGMVEWTQPNGRQEVRTIIKVVGGSYLLSGVPTGMSAGMTVNLVRGCDHSMTGCASHSNILNYGGMPWIPLKNPMSNSSPFK